MTVEIREPGQRAIEVQIDATDRAVALFCDDDFGDILHFRLFCLPVFQFVLKPCTIFVKVPQRLVLLQIIFLTKDKHDDVSVLFNRARLPQVRELWALVVPIFDLTAQL